MQKKLVSVIIPTYNREDLLLNAINSVLNQTYDFFEIIIIDDYSNDETKDLVLSIKDERIKYYRNKQNLYVAQSRNIGIKISSGSIITFLDDDDEMYPTKLFDIIEVFNKNKEINFVYHRAKIMMVNENTYYYTNPIKKVTHNNLVIKNCVGGTPVVTVKRELLYESFDKDIKALEDYELWLNLSLKDQFRPYYLNKYLVQCNYTTKKNSVSKNIDNLLNALKIIKDKYSSSFSKLSSNEINQHNEWINSLIAHKYLLNYNKKSSYYYLKSFYYSYKMKYLVISLLTILAPKLIFKLKK
tara:strand:- start:1729 stop:2625 length:897 start_codon:yes stop_codon:yes gene_type:complete